MRKKEVTFGHPPRESVPPAENTLADKKGEVPFGVAQLNNKRGANSRLRRQAPLLAVKASIRVVPRS